MHNLSTLHSLLNAVAAARYMSNFARLSSRSVEECLTKSLSRSDSRAAGELGGDGMLSVRRTVCLL